LVAFYLIAFWRLYLIAVRAPDDYAMFIAIMAAALIFIHLFINVGMCVGLLPVTGISLPFVSYGGSFLASMLILVGILNNIYRFSIVSSKY
jgi:rod shape determining protein RodA